MNMNPEALAGKTLALEKPLFQINLCDAYAALPWQVGAILTDPAVLEILSEEALQQALQQAAPVSMVIAVQSGLKEGDLQRHLKRCAFRKILYVETVE